MNLIYGISMFLNRGILGLIILKIIGLSKIPEWNSLALLLVLLFCISVISDYYVIKNNNDDIPHTDTLKTDLEKNRIYNDVINLINSKLELLTDKQTIQINIEKVIDKKHGIFYRSFYKIIDINNSIMTENTNATNK